jgi:hypothetical protein
MDMPGESAGSEVLIDLGVYSLAALGADRSAADIKTAFEGKQDALRAAKRGRDASDEAVIAAGALVIAAEVEVEGVVRKIDSRTLELVNKKRGLEPYATLLPGNLAQALAPTGRAQAAEANRIANLLAPATGARLAGITDEIANLAPELRACIAVFVTRIEGLEAAETAAVAAYGAELTTRRVWREQYRKTHALLTALYPSDRRKVESFFKPAKKTKKAATPNGGDPRPSAPTT